MREAGWSGSARIPQLLAVLALSAAWEALFVQHGISLMDEGWPLYAARQLKHGGTLYRDVFWVYPPGHLLPAWIGWTLDPPGILVTRVVYSFFTVALCGALYLLGCRIMSERFALLSAAMVAVAAPTSHQDHVVFGYRYLVFSVGALLLFAGWLRTRQTGWLLCAGLVTGIGANFRLATSFAVACGVGVGLLAVPGSLRDRMRLGAVYALGVVAPVAIVLLWLGPEVDVATLWREIVVRPGGMVLLQAIPWPPLGVTEWSREAIRKGFVALEFRGIWGLCAAALVALAFSWLRATRDGRRFAHPLEVAIAVWATIFFMRSVHRSDEAHLESALPPVCLLFALVLYKLFARLVHDRARPFAEWSVVSFVFAGWVFLSGADLWLSEDRRGIHPLRATEGVIRIADPELAVVFDDLVANLRRLPADARVLDLTVSPMLYVLSGRSGPGGFDVVMPGTFLDPAEEHRFVEHLKRSPPRGVILPRHLAATHRSENKTAPQLWRWVRTHYGGGEGDESPIP